ncbi:MAG TPA: CAP domain-containing protein [Candidatus Saccharimonadales bacterium]
MTKDEEKIRIITAIAIIVAIIIIVLAIQIHKHELSNQRLASSNSSTTSGSNTNPAPQPITGSAVIADINTIRSNTGDLPYDENPELDSAATARAQYMATNNVLDNTSGDPWSYVTNAGYSYSTANLGSTWNQNSAQSTANSFTSGNLSSIGLGESYYDIGIGIASATVDGNNTQIIVAYVGTPQVATQTYWYCWDTGNPSPHHLGYRVSGDHYCTNQELHDAGFAGY